MSGVVASACNPSSEKAEAGGLSEVSLGFTVKSRIALFVRLFKLS